MFTWASSRRATVAVEHSPTEDCIEVYRRGELSSVWCQTKDPELRRWLVTLLREDPALYARPARSGE